VSQSEFVRVIRRKEVIALAFGAMIGWSWVALSGGWIAEAGSAGAILAFALGGIAIILVGLTYAELAAAMPYVGGEHVYSYRALGRRASFFCTWAILLAYVSVVAFEAVALPTVVEYLVPGYGVGYLWTVAGWDVTATWVLVGVAAAVVMTVINVIGIEFAARVQMVITVLILLAGAVLGLSALGAGDSANMEPLFVDGSRGVIGVLVIVPLLMVGFDVIPQSAEEIDLPFAVIGKLLMVSIALAIGFYILIVWGVSMGADEASRNASPLPTASAAEALLGSSLGAKLLIVGGVGGILTSWNAFIIGASRAIYALAHAGQLPAVLGRVHPRFKTPYAAVLLVGALSIVAPFFGRPAMVWLVNAGSFGVTVAYAFVAISFLVLRKREPDMPRPYRVRGGVAVGVAAFVLSIGIAIMFLPFAPAALVWPNEWLIVLGWWTLGLLLMLFAPGGGEPPPGVMSNQ
jgi:amino acid transporter